MNPRKHHPGLLRLELVRAWKVIDALLEGRTENSHVLIEEILQQAEEINQYRGAVRDRDAHTV